MLIKPGNLINSQVGDSSQVLPLCASSPRGLSSPTVMAFYEKGRQSMKAVVSVFTKIRFPVLCGWVPSGPVMEGYDKLWYFCSIFPFPCIILAVFYLVAPRPLIFTIFFTSSYVTYLVSLFSVAYWYRDAPFQLIGAKAKLMMEVIPVLTLAALRYFLPFNYGYPFLSLGCTGYMYIYAHFFHVTYDIRAKDALLGLAMQFPVYMVSGELTGLAAALGLCLGICLYRYVTYCAPKVPAHRKKDLEQEPC